MANVGKKDRILRLVLGVALLALSFLPATADLMGGWAYAPGVAGAVLIATAGLRFCPLYRIIGVNTCGLR